MKKIKEHPYILLSGILLILLGLILVFMSSSVILSFIYYSIGILLILLGITKFMLTNRTKMDTYSGVVNIVVGVLVIFFHNYIITLILGALLLVLPIVRIVQSPNKKVAFKAEFPLIVLGILICFSGDLFATFFFKIIGVLLVVFGVYQFVSIFFERLQIIKVNYLNTSTKHKKRRDVVDVSYEEVSKNEEE